MSDDAPLLVLIGIASELVPDAGIAESRATGSDDPLLRRSFVRAVFALVEALNYARRYVAEESLHLSQDARRRARESARAEKKAAKGQDRSGVATGLRASLAAFAAAEGVENPLSTGGPEWDAFLQAVAVRNRITHPRSPDDCRVSDAEFELVRRVLRWYQGLDTRAMAAAKNRRRVRQLAAAEGTHDG